MKWHGTPKGGQVRGARMVHRTKLHEMVLVQRRKRSHGCWVSLVPRERNEQTGVGDGERGLTGRGARAKQGTGAQMDQAQAKGGRPRLARAAA